MKQIKIFTALFLLSSIFLASCSSIKAVPLAYTSNEEIDVCYIYFQLYKKNEISGATFITYDDKDTPVAEKLTYWSPVEVPANKSIKLYLHLNYKEDRSDCGSDSICGACVTTVVNAFEAARDVNKDIEFNIPPLEPYKDYTISYRKGPGIPGTSFVTLIRNDTKEVIREQEYK